MFEKEAEERYKQHLADPNYYENSEEESYLRGFGEGAEFGYNKANEWHYVKDGDLPKVGVKVLSEQGTLVIYKGDGFNWVEYSPNADNIKLRNCTSKGEIEKCPEENIQRMS